jgi:hypothetical protein
MIPANPKSKVCAASVSQANDHKLKELSLVPPILNELFVKGFPYIFARKAKANPCMLPHHRACQGPIQTFTFIQDRLGIESVRGLRTIRFLSSTLRLLSPGLHRRGYFCINRSLTVELIRSSSSKGTVKHVLISSVKAVLLWWLPPFDPLYLTSFVLRASCPTYLIQIKGVGGS